MFERRLGIFLEYCGGILGVIWEALGSVLGSLEVNTPYQEATKKLKRSLLYFLGRNDAGLEYVAPQTRILHVHIIFACIALYCPICFQYVMFFYYTPKCKDVT